MQKSNLTLYFKKSTPNGITLLRSYTARFDLYSDELKQIPPKYCEITCRDIAIILPRRIYGRVAPRSGIAGFIGIGEVLQIVIKLEMLECLLLITANNQSKLM